VTQQKHHSSNVAQFKKNKKAQHDKITYQLCFLVVVLGDNKYFEN